MYVLVLLSRKESHISIYVSVWSVIWLKSNILLREFIVHVTYILNAITGNIYIGNINSGYSVAIYAFFSVKSMQPLECMDVLVWLNSR